MRHRYPSATGRPPLVALLLGIAACATAAPADPGPPASPADLALVPWPRSVTAAGGTLDLGPAARILAGDPSLRPLAEVLSGEILAATGLRLAPGEGAAGPGDVGLRLDAALPAEAYRLRIRDRAIIEGRDPAAVALGTAAFLQALASGAPAASVPRLAIEDSPAFPYRGLMVDVARRHRSIGTLERCVVLCRLYRIRYLQLHLTDDQAFMFPSTAFPLLTTRNEGGLPSYTLEELRGLERFAADRGVAIVPEMEVPGHAAAMNRAMPDLFLIRGTKPYEHHASINFASPRVLEALDRIVGEMCQVFRTTPWFHIGGDEADFEFAHQNPDFQAAFRELGLGEKGQWQLYRRFIGQMDAIVRKHGKRMLVWEGFHPDPASKFPIPADVTVMEYECPFYPPRDLVRDGRTFINAAWTPLYVLTGHRWSPEKVYGWNPYLLGQFGNNWATIQWHQLEPTPLVQGAQMCSWEQAEEFEIPTLRRRLPAMAERIWNPDLGRPYGDFARRAAAADRLFARLCPSVAMEAEGLAGPDPEGMDLPVFHTPIRVSLRAEGKGAAGIRYTLDGRPPVPLSAPDAGGSRTYDGPIPIAATTTVRAAAFDAVGRPVGAEAAEVYVLKPREE